MIKERWIRQHHNHRNVLLLLLLLGTLKISFKEPTTHRKKTRHKSVIKMADGPNSWSSYVNEFIKSNQVK